MAAKSDDKFIITHKVVDGVHQLIFSPAKPNEGYPPKTVEILQSQWDALKYHFAVGYGGEEEKLIYVH